MNDSSLEIPLPEDDANALIILLNVLHYRNDQVPDALCTHDLVDVVNLADKYLCKDRIQLAARLWVRNMEAVTDALKLARSLTVCRQMEFDGKFSTICRRMLLYSTGEAKLDSDECQYGNLEENFKLAFGKSTAYQEGETSLMLSAQRCCNRTRSIASTKSTNSSKPPSKPSSGLDDHTPTTLATRPATSPSWPPTSSSTCCEPSTSNQTSSPASNCT